jgi:hypothetical protein
MSRHIFFLEHIPFFSISSITHNLIRLDIIRIDLLLFLKILIIYHHRFLVSQIPFPMFNQFVLIILQVLTLYSLAHLKLHSHLQPSKLRLRLWIHLYVNPYEFVSPQNYQILLILVILHHLLPFYLLFIVYLSSLPIKRQFLILFGSKL